MKLSILAASAALLLSGTPSAFAQNAMTFFVTSVGLGDGGNLGGLSGADAHCQKLAEAAGSTGLQWHAYLSATGVNARDRIGTGPWSNAKGQVIATDIANLHSENNKLNKLTALTETGAIVKGRGDQPNQHDILTGSNADGTVATGQTCNDWTSGSGGTAMLGHHDRMGPDTLATAKSWNTAHPSRGCSQAALVSTGGSGLLYCFATPSKRN
ncbi:MAG TPA: DUF1554 domain-containing protein [Devosiaceae bacterium]|nr:DUF1554 domain-containing protein [Devosiaceae bacterium]